MMSQLPIFLSPDAARLLEWARQTIDYRDSFSRVAREEQIPRITIRPGHLYTGWFLAGQFCHRQVADNLHWETDRARASTSELFGHKLVREVDYFVYEVTPLGRDLVLEPCPVVAVGA